MQDVVPYGISKKYQGLSKAKMLREFIKDESDAYVGKAIVLIINYMNDNTLVNDDIKDKSDRLYEIGKRLLGKTTNSKTEK